MTIKQFFGIVEMRTKIISMSTFLMGTLFAVYSTGEFSPVVFIVMLLSVLFVDMGTTGFNAYFDYRNGTDSIQRNSEKNKVILHEGVSEKEALAVSLLMFVLAGITGILIAFLTSWYIIPAGAVCMIVGYAYTGGPFPICRTPAGEIFAGGFLGTVLFMLSYFVQSGTVRWDAFLVSLSTSAVVASILTANNTCDIEGDREAGRKTLSILLGRQLGGYLVYLLGIGAYIWAGLMIRLEMLPVIVGYFMVPAFLLTLYIFRRMKSIGYKAGSKDPIMGSITKVYLLFAAAMLLGLGTVIAIG